MGKKQIKNKYVDLSKLPKRNNGNYNWEQSVGMRFDFIYNTIQGEIVVLDYNKTKNQIKIFIKNYTGIDGRTIYASQLVNCSLDRVLIPKIISTHPCIVDVFKNKDDACKYHKNSKDEIVTVCPCCGKEETYKVCNLAKSGFHCSICDDGISYPNKFMRSLLNQLEINFIPELSKKNKGFEWVQNYKYDFYFEKNNCKYIIEMDGGFHYTDVFNILNSVQKSDSIKDQLAKSNNIQLIRIDCNYRLIENRFNYIKNNVLNSPLRDILCLDVAHIDWELCDKNAISSIVNVVCTMWNDGVYDTAEIANNLKIARITVRNYLKLGKQLGWTDYDGKEVQAQKCRIRNQTLSDRNKKPLAIYHDEVLIGLFDSCVELADKSLELFGRKFQSSVVAKACKGDINSAYGYTMKYIDKNIFNHLVEQDSYILINGGENIEIAV